VSVLCGGGSAEVDSRGPVQGADGRDGGGGGGSVGGGTSGLEEVPEDGEVSEDGLCDNDAAAAAADDAGEQREHLLPAAVRERLGGRDAHRPRQERGRIRAHARFDVTERRPHVQQQRRRQQQPVRAARRDRRGVEQREQCAAHARRPVLHQRREPRQQRRRAPLRRQVRETVPPRRCRVVRQQAQVVLELLRAVGRMVHVLRGDDDRLRPERRRRVVARLRRRRLANAQLLLLFRPRGVRRRGQKSGRPRDGEGGNVTLKSAAFARFFLLEDVMTCRWRYPLGGKAVFFLRPFSLNQPASHLIRGRTDQEPQCGS